MLGFANQNLLKDMNTFQVLISLKWLQNYINEVVNIHTSKIIDMLDKKGEDKVAEHALNQYLELYALSAFMWGTSKGKSHPTMANLISPVGSLHYLIISQSHLSTGPNF